MSSASAMACIPARAVVLPAGADRHRRGRRQHRGRGRDHPAARDQRRVPGYLDAVPARVAAHDTAVAGCGRYRVRRSDRQRDLWRHGHEHSGISPCSRAPSCFSPTLRLSRATRSGSRPIPPSTARPARPGSPPRRPTAWRRSARGRSPGGTPSLASFPGRWARTSTLACLIGAGLLIVTGVGSWRIMLGLVVVGSFLTATMLNLIGSETNPLFNVPFHWHMVLGGWAFGMVYMATDPVSAAHSHDRQVCLRILHRAARDLDSRRQPGLPGRDDAGDPVHEPLRRIHRLLGDPGQRQTEGRPLCSVIQPPTCSDSQRWSASPVRLSFQAPQSC